MQNSQPSPQPGAAAQLTILHRSKTHGLLAEQLLGDPRAAPSRASMAWLHLASRVARRKCGGMAGQEFLQKAAKTQGSSTLGRIADMFKAPWPPPMFGKERCGGCSSLELGLSHLCLWCLSKLMSVVQGLEPPASARRTLIRRPPDSTPSAIDVSFLVFFPFLSVKASLKFRFEWGWGAEHVAKLHFWVLRHSTCIASHFTQAS